MCCQIKGGIYFPSFLEEATCCELWRANWFIGGRQEAWITICGISDTFSGIHMLPISYYISYQNKSHNHVMIKFYDQSLKAFIGIYH